VPGVGFGICAIQLADTRSLLLARAIWFVCWGDWSHPQLRGPAQSEVLKPSAQARDTYSVLRTKRSMYKIRTCSMYAKARKR
jgi:hypothetical protein